jgi:CDP-4-dehydro-6-deoxyglucose reductase
MQRARIVRIEAHHDAVRSFFLAPEEAVAFQAGQFIAIALEAGGAERSYSIANGPGSPELELCVALKPDGFMSPALFSIQTDDHLYVSEPRGSFTLPEAAKEVCLICTGTGIAPFRSMLIHALQQGDNRKFYLISGNRFANEALYHQEMLDLAAAHANFRYMPTLSREQVEGFAHGYVHPVYENLFADGRDASFMVCGWKAMLSDARRRFKALGYNRKQYHFEQYDG